MDMLSNRGNSAWSKEGSKMGKIKNIVANH